MNQMFRAHLRPGLDLGLIEERHAPAVFALVDRDRDYLREWLPWVDATRTEDDTLSFVRSSLERFAANSGFAAGLWDQDQFAGVIGAHKIDWLNRRVEIGYWLGRGFQGKGIMTAAGHAILTHLFVEFDLQRVEIHCASGNEKSCAIARRLGFTREGTMRRAQLLHGSYHDLHLFGLLKSEWQTSTA